MKRYVNASKSKESKYDDAFFNKKRDVDGILLDWAEGAFDDMYEDDDYFPEDDQLIQMAEDLAEENGWLAFETVNEEFESLYEWNGKDVEAVIRSFDTAYGNGERLFPLDYSDGAQEAFYYWIKKYHPEADTSSVDAMFES